MLSVNVENIFVKIQDSFKELLSGISFIVPENSVYTILGRNGSGKSTLIKSFTGLLDKRLYKITGNIQWNGSDLLNLKSGELLKIRKNEIRYVFQDSINSLDPLKKLKYYFDNSDCIKDRFAELLSQFQLPDYKSISEKHSYELSGGMLQRLNFVLALSNNPKLIILDEPTSAIDPMNAVLFIKAIKNYVNDAGNSVFIVTQDLLFAEKVSDKIGLLSNGTITEFVNTSVFFNSEDPRFVSSLEAYKELSK